MNWYTVFVVFQAVVLIALLLLACYNMTVGVDKRERDEESKKGRRK